MTKDFSKLEEKLEIKFKDKELLTTAFVHRSYLNENPSFHLPHNERLEFLGDAVMELVVTEYLYNNFPNPEGELTSWRSSLVNGAMLSKLASKLDFNDYLYLSRGEKKDIGKARELILANCFEAILGALYLDQGYRAVKDFLEKNLIVELSSIIKLGKYVDAKSKFQEISQEKKGITPKYKVIKEKGPDHNRFFTVAAYLDDKKIGTGEGSSKQEAETRAAQDALGKEKWN